MRLKVDRESDALYFRLDESAAVESEEVQPGVILDFNVDGQVIGIEMLDLSKRVAPDKLRILQFEKGSDVKPPGKRIWYSYDEESDVLYLNFKKPSRADDSELTDNDIIIRYENEEIIGVTVLHASTR